ncbi:MAG: GSCFA domain-containing protein [Chitinophagaceae bacterium]|nr:GSCFA domain-containing protein [Chitinophagaceae bacterium]MEA3425382.1 GSCFA domain-containing protein [Bacteroidota bacterium]MCA6453971.1 GSCFA domain-containing protein [Chitinophagaceae bacterium]MCA6454602.1 GSCFA domain-containing protein [Chitinophagaceae bacterium]MCA6459353.1 GSCFA domain-containing protein [Chitinophagaceae bacterium]
MKFHFEFDIKRAPKPVQHPQQLMLMGSCFTENIADKLRKHKFNVLENPNGILFNPVSVVEAVESYLSGKLVTAADIFLHNETWHSWKHHSRYSGITAEECISKINSSIVQAQQYLKHADHLMITLGSAWLYTLTPEAANAVPGSVAANNHKAPANWFRKRLMQVPEAVALLGDMIRKLQAYNPSLQIIFTISPVRHLREGVIENNRSKAILIQAVHELVENFEQLYYFPAYELVIDDLRDYRFYAEDLVHPNYHATQYVWEKFTDACMNEETRSLMKEIAELNLAFQHKPFNPETSQHQKFLKTYLVKTQSLQERYPYLDLSGELEYFRDHL